MSEVKASPEFCSRELTKLRASVSTRKEMEGIDRELQNTTYVQALSKLDPRLVKAACEGWVARKRQRYWPTLADLLDYCDELQASFAERSAVRALPAPAEDLWAADYRQLGVGLQLLRGKCLMAVKTTREQIIPQARALMDRIVAELGGFDAAKRALDAIYADHGDAGIATVVGEALSPPSDEEAAAAYGTPEGQLALRNGVGAAWLHAKRNARDSSIQGLVHDYVVAAVEIDRLPEHAMWAGPLKEIWREKAAREEALRAKHYRGDAAADARAAA